MKFREDARQNGITERPNKKKMFKLILQERKRKPRLILGGEHMVHFVISKLAGGLTIRYSKGPISGAMPLGTF